MTDKDGSFRAGMAVVRDLEEAIQLFKNARGEKEMKNSALQLGFVCGCVAKSIKKVRRLLK